MDSILNLKKKPFFQAEEDDFDALPSVREIIRQVEEMTQKNTSTTPTASLTRHHPAQQSLMGESSSRNPHQQQQQHTVWSSHQSRSMAPGAQSFTIGRSYSATNASSPSTGVRRQAPAVDGYQGNGVVNGHSYAHSMDGSSDIYENVTAGTYGKAVS